ncbi:unnamed protein product [Leptidea sinapis]|uniref:Uncharacterized protein n=1 Tax=Leptidea sinapis TaxID=189913 RepID=A0A5E4Q4T3_9NEOP|nr:unnamed protein product [Leptidea sinapis]
MSRLGLIFLFIGVLFVSTATAAKHQYPDLLAPLRFFLHLFDAGEDAADVAYPVVKGAGVPAKILTKAVDKISK